MNAGSDLMVASANFGGGVETLEASFDRAAALVTFLSNPSGQGDSSATPTVGVVQEMTRLLDPPGDYPAHVAAEFTGGSFYVPCNSTDWYPLAEKWGRRWAEEDITRMEEGMASFARSGAVLSDPSFDDSPKSGDPF